MSESVKKLIVFSKIMDDAITSYAIDKGLMYGDKPHFAAAVRELCGKGLRLDMLEADLRSGNPNFVSKESD